MYFVYVWSTYNKKGCITFQAFTVLVFIYMIWYNLALLILYHSRTVSVLLFLKSNFSKITQQNFKIEYIFWKNEINSIRQCIHLKILSSNFWEILIEKWHVEDSYQNLNISIFYIFEILVLFYSYRIYPVNKRRVYPKINYSLSCILIPKFWKKKLFLFICTTNGISGQKGTNQIDLKESHLIIIFYPFEIYIILH